MSDSNSVSELLDRSPARIIGYCSLFTTLILLGTATESLLTAIIDKYTPGYSELSQAGIKWGFALAIVPVLFLLEKTVFTLERKIKRKQQNNNNNSKEPLLSGSLRDN